MDNKKFYNWVKEIESSPLVTDSYSDPKIDKRLIRVDQYKKPLLGLADFNDYQYACPNDLDFFVKFLLKVKEDKLRAYGEKAMKHDAIYFSIWDNTEPVRISEYKEDDNKKTARIECKCHLNKRDLFKKEFEIFEWL